jgi:hypothetical protein
MRFKCKFEMIELKFAFSFVEMKRKVPLMLRLRSQLKSVPMHSLK